MSNNLNVICFDKSNEVVKMQIVIFRILGGTENQMHK